MNVDVGDVQIRLAGTDPRALIKCVIIGMVVATIRLSVYC